MTMTTSFGAIDQDHHQQLMMGGGGGGCGGGGEIWLDRQPENLLDVNDSSMFYTDFPPLPDFPCMSSSSSSSSTQAPVKPSTCSSASSSSSSAASWTVLKSDAEEDHAKADINHHHHQNYHFREHHQQQQLFYEENMNIPLDASAPGGALSSTASMELIHQPHEEDNQPQMEGVECMDVMENFGYMDLLESNDFFDPSSIFSNESPLEDYQQEEEHHVILHEEQQRSPHEDPKPVSELHYQLDQDHPLEHEHEHELELPIEEETGDDRMTSDEMAEVFLEWLRTNRDNVSAEDLRKIKIKKATIESAARRLGGGRAAMKQLLKLILEWVQTNHLHKKRAKESSTAAVFGAASQFSYQYQDAFQNPNPSINPSVFSPEPNQGFTSQAQWIPPPPAYTTTPAPFMESSAPAFQPVHVGYMGDYVPYSNCGPDVNCGNPYTPQPEFPILDTAPSWQLPQYSFTTPYNFAENNIHTPPPQLPHAPSFGGCGSAFQYPYQSFFNGQGQRLMRLGSSATKEARKKRMARQHRRLLSHHRNHSNNHNHSYHQGNQQSGQPTNQVFDQHARVGYNEGCPGGLGQVGNNPSNWVYWPSAGGGAVLPPSSPVIAPEPLQVVPVDPPMHPQNFSRPATATDRRQGWKPENNLKFLLQKVLKQSDVGNLGRIVLPKKEAETHLPELEARDGISIAMEDIGTSRVWNMRYRFWPNNKSRMYLLENTGDFVRMNGLQEGDFIVIYSDMKCGKYLIRGVKVRQQEGSKAETNRPEKLHKNLHAAPSNNNVNVSSSHPSQRRN